MCAERGAGLSAPDRSSRSRIATRRRRAGAMSQKRREERRREERHRTRGAAPSGRRRAPGGNRDAAATVLLDRTQPPDRARLGCRVDRGGTRGLGQQRGACAAAGRVFRGSGSRHLTSITDPHEPYNSNPPHLVPPYGAGAEAGHLRPAEGGRGAGALHGARRRLGALQLSGGLRVGGR